MDVIDNALSVFRRADGADVHPQEFVARVTVDRDRGAIHVEKAQCLLVVEPHRLGTFVEQAAVSLEPCGFRHRPRVLQDAKSIGVSNRPNSSSDTASSSPFTPHGLSRNASSSHSVTFSLNRRSLNPVRYRTFKPRCSVCRSRLASSSPVICGIITSVTRMSSDSMRLATSMASGPSEASAVL